MQCARAPARSRGAPRPRATGSVADDGGGGGSGRVSAGQRDAAPRRELAVARGDAHGTRVKERQVPAPRPGCGQPDCHIRVLRPACGGVTRLQRRVECTASEWRAPVQGWSGTLRYSALESGGDRPGDAVAPRIHMRHVKRQEEAHPHVSLAQGFRSGRCSTRGQPRRSNLTRELRAAARGTRAAQGSRQVAAGDVAWRFIVFHISGAAACARCARGANKSSKKSFPRRSRVGWSLALRVWQDDLADAGRSAGSTMAFFMPFETRDGGTVLLAEWPAAHRHACVGHLGTSRTRRAPYRAPVGMRYRTPRPRRTCAIHRKWHPLPPPRVAAPGVGDPHSPRHLGVRVDGVTGCGRAPFTRSAMAVPRVPRDLRGLGSDL